MAAAAGTALFRSVASKMAPALPPHRVIAARGLHSSGVGRSSLNPSRLSASSGSSATRNEGPQPHNKEVPSGSQWYRAIVGFSEAAPIAASFLLGGFIYVHFTVNPAMDRMEAAMDAQYQASVTLREEIKKSHERTRAMLLSNKGSQTGVSEGHGIEDV